MKYGRWVIRSKEKRSDSDLFTLLFYTLAIGLYVTAGDARWIGDNFPLLADRFTLPMVAGLSEIEQIESDGQFELPPSALKIDVRRLGFVETVIGVAFEMENRHFNEFMDSTLCHAPGSVNQNPEYLIRKWEIQKPYILVCYVKNQEVIQFIIKRPLELERVRVLVITQQ
ncbi:MAG: hypothetical protein EPO32_02200 [Anaerolineae bacterium]|nr:MAG: hypothetical protein EPO32_02200 [Anaerolineae bacterium]